MPARVVVILREPSPSATERVKIVLGQTKSRPTTCVYGIGAQNQGELVVKVHDTPVNAGRAIVGLEGYNLRVVETRRTPRENERDGRTHVENVRGWRMPESWSSRPVTTIRSTICCSPAQGGCEGRGPDRASGLAVLSRSRRIRSRRARRRHRGLRGAGLRHPCETTIRPVGQRELPWHHGARTVRSPSSMALTGRNEPRRSSG
jgi:hypothetical protein